MRLSAIMLLMLACSAGGEVFWYEQIVPNDLACDAPELILRDAETEVAVPAEIIRDRAGRAIVVARCEVMGGTYQVTLRCRESAEVVLSTSHVFRRDAYEIVALVDCSHSMRNNDPGGERFRALDAFIGLCQGSQRISALGLIAFRDEAELIQPLALPAACANSDQLARELRPRGSTDFDVPLQRAFTMLQERPAENQQAVLLFSDGRPHRTYRNTHQQAGDIAIHTIGLSAEVDQTLMRRIAEDTGGQHIQAPDAASLPRLFAEVFQRIDRHVRVARGLAAAGEPQSLWVDGGLQQAELSVDVPGTLNGRSSWPDLAVGENVLVTEANGVYEVTGATDTYLRLIGPADHGDAWRLSVYLASNRTNLPVFDTALHGGNGKLRRNATRVPGLLAIEVDKAATTRQLRLVAQCGQGAERIVRQDLIAFETDPQDRPQVVSGAVKQQRTFRRLSVAERTLHEDPRTSAKELGQGSELEATFRAVPEAIELGVLYPGRTLEAVIQTELFGVDTPPRITISGAPAVRWDLSGTVRPNRTSELRVRASAEAVREQHCEATILLQSDKRSWKIPVALTLAKPELVVEIVAPELHELEDAVEVHGMVQVNLHPDGALPVSLAALSPELTFAARTVEAPASTGFVWRLDRPLPSAHMQTEIVAQAEGLEEVGVPVTCRVEQRLEMPETAASLGGWTWGRALYWGLWAALGVMLLWLLIRACQGSERARFALASVAIHALLLFIVLPKPDKPEEAEELVTVMTVQSGETIVEQSVSAEIAESAEIASVARAEPPEPIEREDAAESNQQPAEQAQAQTDAQALVEAPELERTGVELAQALSAPKQRQSRVDVQQAAPDRAEAGQRQQRADLAAAMLPPNQAPADLTVEANASLQGLQRQQLEATEQASNVAPVGRRQDQAAEVGPREQSAGERTSQESPTEQHLSTDSAEQQTQAEASVAITAVALPSQKQQDLSTSTAKRSNARSQTPHEASALAAERPLAVDREETVAQALREAAAGAPTQERAKIRQTQLLRERVPANNASSGATQSKKRIESGESTGPQPGAVQIRRRQTDASQDVVSPEVAQIQTTEQAAPRVKGTERSPLRMANAKAEVQAVARHAEEGRAQPAVSRIVPDTSTLAEAVPRTLTADPLREFVSGDSAVRSFSTPRVQPASKGIRSRVSEFAMRFSSISATPAFVSAPEQRHLQELLAENQQQVARAKLSSDLQGHVATPVQPREAIAPEAVVGAASERTTRGQERAMTTVRPGDRQYTQPHAGSDDSQLGAVKRPEYSPKALAALAAPSRLRGTTRLAGVSSSAHVARIPREHRPQPGNPPLRAVGPVVSRLPQLPRHSQIETRPAPATSQAEAPLRELAQQRDDGGKHAASHWRRTMPVLRYSGDWNCDRTAMLSLAHQFERRLGSALPYESRQVALDDPELSRVPFLFMSGHKPFLLMGPEKDALQAYLNEGGCLWINDSSASNANQFDRSVRLLTSSLGFGGLQKIPMSAPIFAAPYDLSKGFLKYRVPPGDKYRVDYLEGIQIDGVWRIIYTRNDYGDGLEINPLTHPLMPSLTDLSPREMLEGSARMGVNIVSNFLTMGKPERFGKLDGANQDREQAETLQDAQAKATLRVADGADWAVPENWSDTVPLRNLTSTAAGARVSFSSPGPVTGRDKVVIATQAASRLEPRQIWRVETTSELQGGARAALAFKVGDQYLETPALFVRPGNNELVFDLGTLKLKSAATEWEFQHLLQTPMQADRLYVLLYPLEQAGVVHIRRIHRSGQ